MKIKPVLKYAIKKLVLATKVAGLVAFTAASAFGIQQKFVANHIEKQNYKTVEHIEEDASLIGTDLRIAQYSKFFGAKYQRLKHNDGEPIYVNISDSFSDVEKQMIKQSFGYYETLFSVINPNYAKYEYVSRMEMMAKMAQGKTVIGISHSSVSEAGGASITVPNPFNRNFTSYAEILINSDNRVYDNETSYENGSEDAAKQSERFSRVFDIIFEEITHVYGNGDVYIESSQNHFWEIGLLKTTDIVHNNTFMNNKLANNIIDLFPEDLKTYVALYGDMRDEKGNIIQEKLDMYLELIELYTSEFVSNRKDLIHQTLHKIYPKQDLEFSDITEEELDGQNIFIGHNNMNFKQFYEEEGFETHRLFDYDMHFDNGVLTFHVTDKLTGKMVESATSNYKVYNGIVFVDGLELPISKITVGQDVADATKDGSISTFVIVKSHRGYELLSIRKINLLADFSIPNQFDLFGKYLNSLTVFKQDIVKSMSANYSDKMALSTKQNLKSVGKGIYTAHFGDIVIPLNPQNNMEK